MNNKTTPLGLTSSALHLLAMALMLCDHLCMTLLGDQLWLHYLGRIAYPIFAFLLVEGFHHTRSVGKYLLRLLVFALISEIPFDLMCGGTWFFPTQQNVLWTFILGLLCMLLIEQTKKLKAPALKYPVFVLTTLVTLLLGFLIGTVTMVDYFGGGIVMILVFYLFYQDDILSFPVAYRKEWLRVAVRWINRALQLYFVWSVCSELIGGLCTFIPFFGREIEVVVESFGVLALLPIWLYRGKKGISTKAFKYLCYAFYPAHIALLVLLKTILF